MGKTVYVAVMVCILLSMVFCVSCNKKAESELVAAIKNGDTVKVESLIKANPSLVNEMGSDKKTPIYWAIRYKNKEIVEFLIANGANLNSRDNIGNTPLKFSYKYSTKEVSQLLIKNGAK